MHIAKVVLLVVMLSSCSRIECFGRASRLVVFGRNLPRFASKSKMRNLTPKEIELDEKSYSKLSRLFVDETLREDNIVRLPKEDAHYVVNVMRMKSGSTVRAFNPKDGEYLAELSCSQRDANLRIVSQIKTPITGESVFPGVLFFAPIKKTRLKTLLEKATELGVQHLVPVITQNTQYPMETASLEAYRKQCIQSAEQCERMTLPELHNPITISELLGEKVPKSSDQSVINLLNLPLLVCAERLVATSSDKMESECTDSPGATGTAVPFLIAVQSLLLPSNADASNTAQVTRKEPTFGVFVGPEGGFTKEEMGKLAALDRAQLVSLGNNVLRAETASIAALSVISCAADTIS